ncbi:MAG TPA: MFS transporter [Gemmatimonadaceae bacterium]|nr:MFS transporter [Gemmatimonadaceae bacterium]
MSFFTDMSSEMIYPLLPLFISTTLGASASFIGAIEGAAESTAALVKLGSGWWSDRVRRRKPLVVAGYVIASAVRPLIGIAQAASQVLLLRVADRVGKGIRTAPRDAMIAESVDPAIRGRAFGFHRSLDHAGAVAGPLLAFVLLRQLGLSLRAVFLLAAIPAAIAVIVLVVAVRETRPVAPAPAPGPVLRLQGGLDKRFWLYLGAVLLFTLGNSTDAFLLLRATDLGVRLSWIPLLWAFLHVVKSTTGTLGGALSDRFGRKPLLVTGWMLYAAVYVAFGLASEAWHVWVLFAVYGIFFSLTEGAERALVADMVPAEQRGSAFGWFHLAIGLGALPASLLFGVLWDRRGPATAFATGAALAMAATLLLFAVTVPQRSQHER